MRPTHRYNPDRPREPRDPHCFTHQITAATALSLAEDAEQSGDKVAAARWFDMASELDRVATLARMERERQMEERSKAEKALEREQLLRYGRKFGF